MSSRSARRRRAAQVRSLAPAPVAVAARTPQAVAKVGGHGGEVVATYSLGASVGGPGAPGGPAGPGEPSVSAFKMERPRLWDYPQGYNRNARPRKNIPVTYETMQAVADNWDFLRIAIERKKDLISGLTWRIAPVTVDGMARAEVKARAERLAPARLDLTKRFKRPDTRRGFIAWQRELLENIIVLDAGCLYRWPSLDGGPFGVKVVDGATISVLIDEDGDLPLPPYPAYQQLLQGRLADSYTTDELLYAPMRPRRTSPYGMSPVEWLLMTANRVLNRQRVDLSWFTDGTIPGGFISTPDTWSDEKIAQFQLFWDAILSQDQDRGNKVRFVPGGPGTGWTPVTPQPTSDVELFLDIMACAALSLSPMEFGIMPPSGSGALGTATLSEAQEQVTRSAAVKPVADHLKQEFYDILIADFFGQPELEFIWEGMESKEDELARAQAEDVRIKNGTLLLDEARELNDLDGAWGEGYTMATGSPVAIEELKARAKVAATMALIPEEPAEDQPADEPDEAVDEAADTDGNAPKPFEKASGSDAALDLKRWRTKALRAAKAGQYGRALRFESDAIPEHIATSLRASLAKATVPADVSAAFAALTAATLEQETN